MARVAPRPTVLDHLAALLVLLAAVALLMWLLPTAALAQDAPPAAPAAEGPGLIEWVRVACELAGVTVVILTLLGYTARAQQLRTVIGAVETFSGRRPEVGPALKAQIRAEAEKHGTQAGLDKQVQKVTG